MSRFAFPMIILNLVGLIILFIINLYIYKKHEIMAKDLDHVESVQKSNNLTVKNLVDDINHNDIAISNYVNAKHYF